MSTWEKFYSILAILFAAGLLSVLALLPELRQFNQLLTACLAGLLVNTGLLFIVLRDIFLRQFADPNRRFFWIVMVLLLWPSIVYYLLRHGFRPRT